MSRFDLRRAAAVAALLVLVFAAHGSLADDETKSAYEARKGGQILALTEILAKLDLKESELVEVEFEDKDGVPVYEIYFVDQRGRRREIKVDARTGGLLGKESD